MCWLSFCGQSNKLEQASCICSSRTFPFIQLRFLSLFIQLHSAVFFWQEPLETHLHTQGQQDAGASVGNVCVNCTAVFSDASKSCLPGWCKPCFDAELAKRIPAKVPVGLSEDMVKIELETCLLAALYVLKISSM